MPGEQVAARRTRRRRTIGLVGVLLMVVVLAPGVAGAAPDPPEPGQVTSGTVTSGGTDYEYLLYRPGSYDADRVAPLLVVIHGCQTTAQQQMRATGYNQLAEREGFVVLYPDVDWLGRLLPGPANQCWKFPYPPAWTRDHSDAAAIADMTRAVMGSLAIDPERVYVIGVSAGGLMAAIEAAAHPDLFAAVGIVQSAGYADWPCFTTGIGIPVALSAQLAFLQMGPRARVVPRFVIGSDADVAFPAACADKALEQGLRTNNLVLSGRQEGPLSLRPAAVRTEQEPGRRAYTVSSFHDPDGCLVAEQWLINGMPHAWPGGTDDPSSAGFTDPTAPSGAEGSWAFFERYRRSDTAMPCATADASAPASPPMPAAADPGQAAAPSDTTGPQAGTDRADTPPDPPRTGPSTLPATGSDVAGWQPVLAMLAALVLRAAGRGSSRRPLRRAERTS